MYEKKWEVIDGNSSRLKVPGGWIVRSYLDVGISSRSCSIHQVFIPDPEHLWIFED
jgi:hypothetical protein